MSNIRFVLIGKFNDNDKTVIAIKSKDNNLKLFRALTKKIVLKFMLCETMVYYHGFSMYFTYVKRISLSKNSIIAK